MVKQLGIIVGLSTILIAAHQEAGNWQLTGAVKHKGCITQITPDIIEVRITTSKPLTPAIDVVAGKYVGCTSPALLNVTEEPFILDPHRPRVIGQSEDMAIPYKRPDSKVLGCARSTVILTIDRPKALEQRAADGSVQPVVFYFGGGFDYILTFDAQAEASLSFVNN